MNLHLAQAVVELSPLLYAAVLAIAVGLGLPAGFLVVGAGTLFDPWLGLGTVLAGEAIGLVLNWRLCRGVLRPRMQRWLAHQRRGPCLHDLLLRSANLRLLLVLRLCLIPMNLVNAACALGATPVRPYALASLMLVPRFMLMVLAGSLGASAVRSSPTPLLAASRLVMVGATVAVVVLLVRRLLPSEPWPSLEQPP